MARVQFPLPAPRDVRKDIGTAGTSAGKGPKTGKEETGKKHTNAHIAQSAERVLGKDEVIGSNPIVSTIVGVDAGRHPRPPGESASRKRRARIIHHKTLATPI